PTGIEHGTVTAVVDAPEPPRHFEITSLRRDVETYGRRARVVFDADWAEDAARRDFTINAIYLDPDGTLHDPVGGVADLEARRVRPVALEPRPDPLRCLAALIETDAAGAVALAERLRFSNEQRDRLAGLAQPWPLDPAGDARAERLALYRLGAERYRDMALLL